MVLEVATWDAGHPYAAWVHAGDVAWLMRQPDGLLAEQLHGWWDDDELVALSINDPDMARPKVRPDRSHDPALAASLADVVEALTGAHLVCDAEPGTALRVELVDRGWTPDPDPYVAFFADGRIWSAETGGLVQLAEVDPPARVAVQRAGFARSTFDEPSWQRMAAGPGYLPQLDVVVLDPEDGVAAACSTGWLSVPGGPAVIEPVATAGPKQGHGFGRQAVVACVAACLEAGASGVSVATPGSNAAARATYRSAGMRFVETIQGVVLDRSS